MRMTPSGRASDKHRTAHSLNRTVSSISHDHMAEKCPLLTYTGLGGIDPR
jgi:hypothetical protein